MIVVTTQDIPGYRVTAVLGEVMGLTVRSANLGANLTAGFRALGGGEMPEYTQLVYESRQQVLQRMIDEALRRGANAIVATRFDSEAIAQSFSEICVYGTAVVVEPLAAGQPGATPQSAQQAAQAQVRPPAPVARVAAAAQPPTASAPPPTASAPPPPL